MWGAPKQHNKTRHKIRSPFFCSLVCFFLAVALAWIYRRRSRIVVMFALTHTKKQSNIKTKLQQIKTRVRNQFGYLWVRLNMKVARAHCEPVRSVRLKTSCHYVHTRDFKFTEIKSNDSWPFRSKWYYDHFRTLFLCHIHRSYNVTTFN